MSKTMPQIILLNHAAWFNGKQAEKRSKQRQEIDENTPKDSRGIPLDELDSAGWERYYRDL